MEVFKKGKVNLMLGDNMEFMASKPDNYYDLTITSPPYNLGNNHHTGNKRFAPYEDDLKESDYQDSQLLFLGELFRKTKKGGSLIYNHKNRISKGVSITPYAWLLKTEWTIKQEIVWFNRSQNFDKVRFYPMTERIYWLSKGIDTKFNNNINSHDLIKFNSVGTKGTHKRAFPLNIPRMFLLCFPENINVFDPYLGSGTTAIACNDFNNSFDGIEKDPDYYNDAVKRFKAQTMQTKIF